MTDSITRILVPVDFSAHSDRAVHYAATLARQTGAAVELLHVVEDPFRSAAFTGEIYVPGIIDVQALVNDATARVLSIKNSAFPHGTDVEAVVLVGRPPQTIVDYARSGGSDLIVMGTHGRTGLSHLVMGSVAERVVQLSPCAVLTVRDGGAQEEHKPAPRQVAYTS
jgi:nucleotide-binding universal stress UspA family protein